MANNDSLQLFVRLVKEKHQQLINASTQMLRMLSGEDVAKKKEAAENLLKAANDLCALMAKQDVPDWLTNTINHVAVYISGNWTAFDFLGQHIAIKSQLDNHTWVFESQSEAAFDFDAIYESFKRESKLPGMFEQVVKILEDIESSGEVDSVTMLKGLGKVIATIKKGKDGSYFSLNGAWQFLLSFMKNYMWGELSKIPVLGTMLEALEKTINETSDEMSKLSQNIQAEMSKVVESEIKALKNKSEFQFITYTQAGSLTSCPQNMEHSAII